MTRTCAADDDGGGGGGGVQVPSSPCGQCEGETPYCDEATLTCGVCRFHAECPASACNAFTGACLDAVPQTVGPEGTHASLGAALAALGDDEEEAVFWLASEASTGTYVESLVVEGRVVAVLGWNARPVLRGAGAQPTVEVASDATLLLDSVSLRGHVEGRALTVAGRLLLERGEVVGNPGGGVEALGADAELRVRNSIVAANGWAVVGVELGEGSLELLYSTVASEPNAPATVRCAPGGRVVARNSIVFSRGEGTLACGDAEVSRSASDESLGGDNYAFSPSEELFADMVAGNLRLTPDGRALFASLGRWRRGDPPTDVDGGARPSVDGSSDAAGAHLGF